MVESPEALPDVASDLSREAIANRSCKFLLGGYRDKLHTFSETNRPV